MGTYDPVGGFGPHEHRIRQILSRTERLRYRGLATIEATGPAGLSNIEYIGNHVCSSKTVTHSVYHNAEYPSHLLLPVIPL